MEHRRINGYLTKRYKLIELPSGIPMLMPVFNDLTDGEIRKAINHFSEAEDYEYASELALELESRRIRK